MAEQSPNKEVEPTGNVSLLDIDNTLIEGFTIFPFTRFLEAKSLVIAGTFQTINKDVSDYRQELLDYHQFAIKVVDDYCAGLKGHKQEEVIKAGEEFLESYLPSLKPYTTNLIHLLNNHGTTIAVSGAPLEAFNPLARHVGIHQTYLLEAETENGTYTGRPKINMAIAEEKQRIVSNFTNINRDKSFAFGDSTSDLPILEAVSNPFAVDPSEELATIAQERGWTVVNSQNIIEKVTERLEQLKSP